MNKFLRYSLLVLSLHLGVWAQNNLPSVARFEVSKNVPVLQLAAPDLNQIALEDELREKKACFTALGLRYQVCSVQLIPAPGQRFLMVLANGK